MYKVMLVDDDYPVLELLSEVVDWGARGLVLCGKYENGMAAWETCTGGAAGYSCYRYRDA